MISPILLLHTGCTWLMVGLIWTIQLVHYPLFKFASRESFPIFEKEHQKRITWIIAPVMLLELGSSIGLFYENSLGSVQIWVAINFGINLLLWMLTAFLQMPLHKTLERGWDADAARRLVQTNWVRTVLWSIHGLIVLLLLFFSEPEITLFS